METMRIVPQFSFIDIREVRLDQRAQLIECKRLPIHLSWYQRQNMVVSYTLFRLLIFQQKRSIRIQYRFYIRRQRRFLTYIYLKELLTVTSAKSHDLGYN